MIFCLPIRKSLLILLYLFLQQINPIKRWKMFGIVTLVRESNSNCIFFFKVFYTAEKILISKCSILTLTFTVIWLLIIQIWFAIIINYFLLYNFFYLKVFVWCINPIQKIKLFWFDSSYDYFFIDHYLIILSNNSIK